MYLVGRISTSKFSESMKTTYMLTLSTYLKPKLMRHSKKICNSQIASNMSKHAPILPFWLMSPLKVPNMILLHLLPKWKNLDTDYEDHLISIFIRTILPKTEFITLS